MAHLLFSAQARDARRRERLADALEHVVRDAHAASRDAAASVLACERQILLIAAVLRSSLALPDDGVRAARRLIHDRSGSLRVLDSELPEDLFDVEELLGMHGRRPAARAIAAGEVTTPPGSEDG